MSLQVPWMIHRSLCWTSWQHPMDFKIRCLASSWLKRCGRICKLQSFFAELNSRISYSCWFMLNHVDSSSLVGCGLRQEPEVERKRQNLIMESVRIPGLVSWFSWRCVDELRAFATRRWPNRCEVWAEAQSKAQLKEIEDMHFRKTSQDFASQELRQLSDFFAFAGSHFAAALRLKGQHFGWRGIRLVTDFLVFATLVVATPWSLSASKELINTLATSKTVTTQVAQWFQRSDRMLEWPVPRFHNFTSGFPRASILCWTELCLRCLRMILCGLLCQWGLSQNWRACCRTGRLQRDVTIRVETIVVIAWNLLSN